MEKAIVTGGAGFIGSHMAELLLEKGFEVAVIDNMSNGQQENIDIFKSNPNYEFKKIELSKKFDESIFKNTSYVFHFAGLADIVPSVESPIAYHESNVTATLRVLEASRKYNAKKFIYAASSSCYGIPDKYPTTEDAEIKPQYPYALTKYMGELYVMFWSMLYGLPSVSLRLFNVYGPRARTNNAYGAVFKVFLTQKLHNSPLTIVGDGTQARDFVYVKDVAEVAFLAAESELNQEVINIGVGKPQSVNCLAELIGGDKVYLPKRPGEPDSTHADISKAKKLLKWEPKVSFEEGVKLMLDNIDYWKDAPIWDKESIGKATKKWFEYLNKKNSPKESFFSNIRF